MALHLTRLQVDAIRDHARSAVPRECCGFLVGTREGDHATVCEVHPAVNASPGNQSHRYEIDAREHLRCQRESRARGMVIVGFYHSHPGHEPEPSAFDADLAWPDYSYLIVSLDEPPVSPIRSWRFDPAAKRFAEEAIELE